MGRAPCCDKTGLKKGPWTSEEDQKLVDYIQKNGHGSWRTLPKNAGLARCGKSCRLRWTNYLRPEIKRGRFSFEEEESIIQLHSILGNKWSAIAARLPGRTDNEIKNYWNTHIRKRLLRMGIDPVTHSPRFDLMDLSSILVGSSSLCNPNQLNLSRLLGIEPLVNSELLRLATNILSSSTQNEHPNLLAQYCLQVQNQFQNPSQIQNTYSSLQNAVVPDQLPNSTTSNAQFFDNVQLMQRGNTDDQFVSKYSTDLNCQITQPNLWQGNDMFSSLEAHRSVPSSCFNLCTPDQAILNPRSGASNFQLSSDNQDFSFSSVVSTPASSPTHFNSYINGSGNTTPSSTCIISSTEDERDSNCSNMLKFEIPDLLDLDEFM